MGILGLAGKQKREFGRKKHAISVFMHNVQTGFLTEVFSLK